MKPLSLYGSDIQNWRQGRKGDKGPRVSKSRGVGSWFEATQTQGGRTQSFVSNEVYTECRHPELDSAMKSHGGLSLCVPGEEDKGRKEFASTFLGLA